MVAVDIRSDPLALSASLPVVPSGWSRKAAAALTATPAWWPACRFKDPKMTWVSWVPETHGVPGGASQSVFVSIASIVLKLWRHWHPHVLFSGGGRQTLSFLDGWPSGAGHVTLWFERGGQAAIEIRIRSFLVGRIYWNLLKSSAILVESWSLKYQVL